MGKLVKQNKEEKSPNASIERIKDFANLLIYLIIAYFFLRLQGAERKFNL